MNVGTKDGYTIRDGENVIKVSTEGLTESVSDWKE
jgi:hypothetical protein